MPSQGIQKGMREGSEERRVKTKRRSRWDGVFATSRNVENPQISTSKGVGGMGKAIWGKPNVPLGRIECS